MIETRYSDEPWFEETDFGVIKPFVAGDGAARHTPDGKPEEAFAQPMLASLDAFAATEEETSQPLLGSSDEPLLSAGGMLLMYGDGGAGKTTLTLDAVSHLASSTAWLGIDVPEPCRIVMIENEGPRGMFRRKVQRKIAGWQGEPFSHNVSILEEPWTRFTLADARNRSWLAEQIEAQVAAICVMGPLTTLGMVGGGTPDEILRFENYLSETRELCARPFAWWIVHHENKAGDVSGAWERVPDVLCHVQARGNGLTHVVWRKARWSGTLHGTSVDLVWTDGEGYELHEQAVRDLHAELPAAMVPGTWYTAKELVKLVGAKDERVREVTSHLRDAGVLDYETGPAGRHPTARCWRLHERDEGHEPGLLEEDLRWR